jgi:hypothetical protein
MKRLLCILSLLIFGSLSSSLTSGPAPPAGLAPLSSFEEVLDAHGGRAAIAEVKAFTAEAVKLVPTSSTEAFERKVVVSTDGSRALRHTSDPLGLRTHIESLDGGSLRASVIERGADGEPFVVAEPADETRQRAVKYMIESTGLVPFLQKLARPRAVVVAQSQASGGLERFSVQTEGGVMVVEADAAHLIRQIEIGGRAFHFADYRPVGALRLPFIERLTFGDRLVFEWFFSRIDLNPKFASDYFEPVALR